MILYVSPSKRYALNTLAFYVIRFKCNLFYVDILLRYCKPACLLKQYVTHLILNKVYIDLSRVITFTVLKENRFIFGLL